MRGQPGFFDFDDRLKLLSDLGDQLESFRSAVDFELFRPEYFDLVNLTISGGSTSTTALSGSTESAQFQRSKGLAAA
jgi:hypothetical protein